MTAFDAARYAVVGASTSMQRDLRELGVRTIVINTNDILPENLFEPVRSKWTMGETQKRMCNNDQLIKQCLPEYAVRTVFDALLEPDPKATYTFEKPSGFVGKSLFKFKTASSDAGKKCEYQYI